MLKKIRQKKVAREQQFRKEQADILNKVAEMLASEGFLNVKDQSNLIRNLAVGIAYFTLTLDKNAVVKAAKTGRIVVPDHVLDAYMEIYNTREKWNELSIYGSSETLRMATAIQSLMTGASAGLRAV